MRYLAISLIFPRRIGLPILVLEFVGLSLIPYCGFLQESGPGHTTMLGFYTDPIILLFVLGVGIAVVRHRWGGNLAIEYPIILVLLLFVLDVTTYYTFHFQFSTRNATGT